ncbi:MAG: YkvI family membrane protein [Bacillota bacterium]
MRIGLDEEASLTIVLLRTYIKIPFQGIGFLSLLLKVKVKYPYTYSSFFKTSEHILIACHFLHLETYILEEMKKGGGMMRKNWVTIFQIAATYIGTVVGAGFATGKEIIEFFTNFGVLGFFGILISGLLFVVIGTKIMFFAHRIQAHSYQEFNTFLFGNSLGRFINGLTFIILFGVTSVMLSGTGAIFHEQLGLPYQVGILFTLVLCFYIMTKGLDGVLGINALVVPMMLFFGLILLIPTVSSDQPLFQNLDWGLWRGYVNPFIYVSFNLAMAQAVLIPLGKEINDENTIRWGGFWGGIGLLFILLSCHLALSIQPNVNSYDIPMAEVIKGFGLAVHILFIIVIYGEIITTLVGNVFGLSRQMQRYIPLSGNYLVLVILGVSYIISLVGFGVLVEFLYPIFGYVGLLILFTVAYQKLPS